MADITSANTVLILSAPLILPIPQSIQGFSTEDIFSSTAIQPVETMMGIDGNLSGGYVPRERKVVITLMADSPSNSFFDALQAAQDAGFTAYKIFGTLTYPAIGMAYVMSTGFLTEYPPTSDSKRVLQPRRYGLTFQSILGAPISAAG